MCMCVCVCVTCMEFSTFCSCWCSGPARVFDNEFDAWNAVLANKIKPNDVVVIRYVGPKVPLFSCACADFDAVTGLSRDAGDVRGQCRYRRRRPRRSLSSGAHV